MNKFCLTATFFMAVIFLVPVSTAVNITLRPTGDGTYTFFIKASCDFNWQCVDEDVADDAATHVYDFFGTTNPDTYTHPASGISLGSSITQIEVGVRAMTAGSGSIKIMIRSNGIDSQGPAISLTSSYTNYSQVWATDPATGIAWNISAVDNVQIGMNHSSGTSNVTQVWMVVTYDPILFPPKRLKVGFSGNVACKTYEPEHTCPVANFTSSDYEAVRLSDSSFAQLPGEDGFSESFTFRMNATPFAARSNISNINVLFKGQQNCGGCLGLPHGFSMSLRNFSDNSWVSMATVSSSSETAVNVSTTSQDFVNSANNELWVLLVSRAAFIAVSGSPYVYARANGSYKFVQDAVPFSFMKSLKDTSHVVLEDLDVQDGNYIIAITEPPEEEGFVENLRLYAVESNNRNARFLPDKHGNIYSISKKINPYKIENNSYYFQKIGNNVKIVFRASHTKLSENAVTYFFSKLGGNNYNFYDSMLSLPFINSMFNDAVDREAAIQVMVNGKEITKIRAKSNADEPYLQEYLAFTETDRSEVKVDLLFPEGFYAIHDIYIDDSENLPYKIYELESDFKPFATNHSEFKYVHFAVRNDTDRRFILSLSGWYKTHWALHKNVSLGESLKYFYSDVMPAISGKESWVEKNKENFPEYSAGNTFNANYFYVNFSYIGGLDTTPPNVSYRSPANNTVINASSINFVFNASDKNVITSCNLTINNTANQTLSEVDDYFNLTFSVNFASSQKTTWGVNCTDNSNNTATAGNFNLTIDITAPSITIQSPSQNGAYEEDALPTLNFNAVDNFALDKCWYILNSESSQSLANCNNLSSIGNTSFSSNTLRVYANDSAGNVNFSEIKFTFFITSPRHKVVTGKSIAHRFAADLDGNVADDTFTVKDSFISQDNNNVVLGIAGKGSGSRFQKLNDTVWTMDLKQSFQNNKMFLTFTRSNYSAVENKMAEIDRFNMVSKTFGSLIRMESSAVFLRLEYKDINILDSLRIPPNRNILIENRGRDNSLTNIAITRKEG